MCFGDRQWVSLYTLAEALCLLASSIQICIGKQDDEFFASKPRQEIGIVTELVKTLRNFLDDIVAHSMPVFVINPLEQNDLWGNGVDYSGIAPSPTDLYVDPIFVDINTGDLHLAATSELIDRADDYGLPLRLPDIDGQPRPLDGNGDGFNKADIGADELFAGAPVLQLQVDPGGAMAGQAVQVMAVVQNPEVSAGAMTYSSAVPAGMSLVTNSLDASQGDLQVEGQGEAEQVVWRGSLPAQQAVVLRYRLRVDADTDRRAVVTLAAATEAEASELAQQATASILINPSRTHIPLAVKQAQSRD